MSGEKRANVDQNLLSHILSNDDVTYLEEEHQTTVKLKLPRGYIYMYVNVCMSVYSRNRKYTYIYTYIHNKNIRPYYWEIRPLTSCLYVCMYVCMYVCRSGRLFKWWWTTQFTIHAVLRKLGFLFFVYQQSNGVLCMDHVRISNDFFSQ